MAGTLRKPQGRPRRPSQCGYHLESASASHQGPHGGWGLGLRTRWHPSQPRPGWASSEFLTLRTSLARMVGARGWGSGQGGVFNGDRTSVWEEKKFRRRMVVMVAQQHQCA